MEQLESRLLLAAWYVDASAGGANTGASWANAFADLQAALLPAASGDQIYVAAGTYRPTTAADRSVSFVLKTGVAVYGGFPAGGGTLAQRDPAAHVTILSGNNAYHVVVGSGANATAILDGFTITGGNADGADPDSDGGGILNDGGSPTLNNLTLVGNHAIDLGGGMYNNNGAQPALTHVLILNNSAPWGGGMNNRRSNPALTDVTFSNNSATQDGGGMENWNGAAPALTHVTFDANTATGGGGGLGNSGAGAVALTDVTFTGNYATLDGGGMYNDSSSPTLSHVTFSGNSARSGAGISNHASNPALTYVDFLNNAARQYGGGMSSGYVSAPVLTHVTFVGNTAAEGGGIAGDGPLTVTAGTFIRNAATSLGGGLSTYQSTQVKLTSVVFAGNTAVTGGAVNNNEGRVALTNGLFVGNAAHYGAGLYNQSAGATLVNVTFASNAAAFEGGALYGFDDGAGPSNTTLTNCILWGDTAPIRQEIDDVDPDGVATITYSDVAGSYPGVGNLNANPQFLQPPAPGADGTWGTADDDYGNLRPLRASPCVDAGSNAAVPAGITTDQAGNPRFVDQPGPATGAGTPPIVDMGALEATNATPTATVALSSHSPLTNDMLTATATTFDADGDPVTVTYVWKVNGTVRKTTAGTAALTDTFDLSTAGNGQAGDVITVEATPSDGTVNGGTVTASDSATVADSAPSIQDRSFTLSAHSPNGTVIGTMTATDPDSGQVLTFAITAGNAQGGFAIDPATGIITLANAAALDLPNTPSITLTVQATDNGTPALSDTATVALTVFLNTPPVAIAQSVAPGPDGTVMITLAGTDPETPAADLVIAVSTGPAQGTLVHVAGDATGTVWQYSVGANYSGSDSFQFTVTDNGAPAGSHASPGDMTSAPATVTIAGGRVMPLSAKGKATFADSQSVPVTVQLTGGGAGRIFFTNADPAAPCDAGRIVLSGTGDKSTLTITTKGRNVTTTIQAGIAVTGSLKGLTAKTTVLSGQMNIGASASAKAAVALSLSGLNGAAIDSALPIKSLTVGGAVANSTIRSAHSIVAATMASVTNSRFLAGIDTDCAVHPLPPAVAGHSDFTDPLAIIKTFTVKGVRGGTGDFFADTNLSAANLGTISLVNANFTGSGIYASTSGTVKAIKYTNKADKTQCWSWPVKPGKTPPPAGLIQII